MDMDKLDKLNLKFAFVLSYIISIVSVLWLFKDGTYAALIASLGSISTLTGSTFFYFKNKYNSKKGKVSKVDDVIFYHNIRERQILDIDVRGLISKSQENIFISGVSLFYVISKCKDDLLRALKRGVQGYFILKTSMSSSSD
ncbi:MAG: hypothetical protein AB4206_05930 [Xenococcaceae cyanobacterium]